MRLRLTILAVSMVLLTPIFPGACASNNYSASTNTNLPLADRLMIDNVISALGQVGSYQMDSDFINYYKSTDDPNFIPTTDEWKSSRLINITVQEMGMSMTITPDANFSFELYVKDGYEYFGSLGMKLYEMAPSSKTQLNDFLWNGEIQLPYLLEVLEAATGFSRSADETVNRTDCYVFEITSTVQAMLDLVVSQDQPVGPSIDSMWGGGLSVVRTDAYKSGSVKLWVDVNSYLPLKVVFNADFQGFVGVGSQSGPTPTTNPMDSSFQGELDFSNYNQPVVIDALQAALDATP